MGIDRAKARRVGLIVALAATTLSVLTPIVLNALFTGYFFHPFLTHPVPRGSVVFYGRKEGTPLTARFYRIDYLQVTSGKRGRVAFFYGEEQLVFRPYPLFFDGGEYLYVRAPNKVVYSLELASGNVERTFSPQESDGPMEFCLIGGKLITGYTPAIRRFEDEEERGGSEILVRLCGCGSSSVVLEVEQPMQPQSQSRYRLVRLDLVDGTVRDLLVGAEGEQIYLRGALTSEGEVLYLTRSGYYLKTPTGTRSWALEGFGEWFLGERYLYRYLDNVLSIRDKQSLREIMSVRTTVPVNGVLEFGFD